MSAQSVGPAGTRAPAASEDERGTGWLVFAGTLLAIVGTMNVIQGIAAIDNSKFFVNDTKYIFSDLNTWGWVALVFGAIQLLTAFGVWARSTSAAVLGIAFASLNAVAQLLAIPSYPLLSLALFAMDILVVYGLIAYGGRR